MGATKKEAYSQEQIDKAKLFKALAHPARIAAIEKLLLHKDELLSCKELKEGLDISQSTFSRHLTILFEAGIIQSKIVNTYKTNALGYRVNIDTIDIILLYLNRIKRYLEKYHPPYTFYSIPINFQNWKI